MPMSIQIIITFRERGLPRWALEVFAIGNELKSGFLQVRPECESVAELALFRLSPAARSLSQNLRVILADGHRACGWCSEFISLFLTRRSMAGLFWRFTA